MATAYDVMHSMATDGVTVFTLALVAGGLIALTYIQKRYAQR